MSKEDKEAELCDAVIEALESGILSERVLELVNGTVEDFNRLSAVSCNQTFAYNGEFPNA